ncbi:MAG: hypothetical protein KJ915_02550 [Candidatus Omnitrophica bacterium]|nr:hypothetical protein [Candidatus Omnitrophota bacterium]
MFIKKTTTIKLISAVLINAFLLLDFTWAAGASFDAAQDQATLSLLVQISQDYFLAEFKQKSLDEEIAPIESFPVKTQDLPDSTEYIDKDQEFKGISIEHFICAQYFLAKQDISKVLASLKIAASGDEKQDRLQAYKILCSKGYSKQIIDLINGDMYKNPRLNLAIFNQNIDARAQSIYEAVSNSLDALGLDIGQFGEGVKQILAWLEPSGIDKVEVFTKTQQGLPHKLTILKDKQDQLFIQINQISPDVYNRACSDQQEQGTVVKLSVANKIPGNRQESGDSGLNSLEEIKAGIHRRFAYITSVEVTTQINQGAIETVNNFNTKEIIVPEKNSGKLISDTQGRKVAMQLDSHSITISDNGKGMDAGDLSNMFVPVIGGTKTSHVLSPKEVQEELDKIKVIQDRTLASCVSFSRNGEVVAFFDIKNNFQADSTLQGGICIEAGKLFEVDKSRAHIRMSVNLKQAKKSNFQLAIERTAESLLEHKQLTDLEKIQYINSLVIGLDGIAGSNEDYKYVAKTLRMQIKKNLQEKKIIERLRQDDYIILPNDKEYSKLAIPAGKKALYLHEQLFDWHGAISLEALGGTIISQITIDEDKKLPLVIVPFNEEYMDRVKNFHKNWHTWTKQDRLPIIENKRFIAIASQLAGNRLLELINQKLSTQGLSKIEEDELLFILHGINILTAQEVFTSYEVVKPRKNLMFENIELKTRSGTIYSAAENKFLSKPPLVEMSNQELNSKNQMPEDAKQKYMVLANNDLVNISDGKVIMRNIESIEALRYGGYKLKTKQAEPLFFSWADHKMNPKDNGFIIITDQKTKQVCYKGFGLRDGKVKGLNIYPIAAEAIFNDPQNSDPEYVVDSVGGELKFSPGGRFAYMQMHSSALEKEVDIEIYDFLENRPCGLVGLASSNRGLRRMQQDILTESNSRFINLQFSADDKYLVFEQSSDDSKFMFAFFTTRDEQAVNLDELLDIINCRIELNRFATVVYIQDKDNKMRLFDLESMQLINSVPVEQLHTDSSGSYTVLVNNYEDKNITVYDHVTKQPYTTLPSGEMITGARTIYKANGEFKFTVFNNGSNRHYTIDQAGELSYSPTFSRREEGFIYETITNKTVIFHSNGIDDVLKFRRFSPEQKLKRGLIFKHPYTHIVCKEKNKYADSKLIAVAADATVEHLFAAIGVEKGKILLIRSGLDGREIAKTLKDVCIDNLEKPRYVIATIENDLDADGFVLLKVESDKITQTKTTLSKQEYDAVQWDGIYFVFTNAHKGRAAYLNPDNPKQVYQVQVPMFVAVVKQEALQSGEIPNDARQVYTLLDNGDIVKIGTQEKADSNVKSLEYMQNGYYLVEKYDGIQELKALDQTRVSATEVFCLKLSEGRKIKYSQDKRFVYVQSEDNGIGLIMFDCKLGEYFDASTMIYFPQSEVQYYLDKKLKASLNPLDKGDGLPEKKLYDLQFSRDGKKMLFKTLSEGKYYLVMLKIADKLSEDYSLSDSLTKTAFNAKDNPFQEMFQERLEAGKAKVWYLPNDFDFKIHPLSNAAYVQSKSSKNMILFNLARQEIVLTGGEAIEFLHTDSAGIYTMLYYRNHQKAIYHHLSGELIEVLPDGNSPDYIETVYDGQTIRMFCTSQDPKLGGGNWFELDKSGEFIEIYGSWSQSFEAIISEVQTDKQLYWNNKDKATIYNATLKNLDPLSEENLKQYQIDQNYQILVVNDTFSSRVIIPESGRQFNSSVLGGELLFYNQDTVTVFTKGKFLKQTNMLARHINNQYTAVECVLDNNSPHKFMVALIPISETDSEYRLFSFEKKHMPLSNLGMNLFDISTKKFTQVTFDGKYFMFIDPKTADAVYLDPAHPEAKRFILGHRQEEDIDDQQIYAEKKKVYEAWKQKVLVSRDQFLAQAENIIEEFIEKTPIEFRSNIENKIKSSIEQLYDKQDSEIRQRFDDFIKQANDFDFEQPLPFDIFSQRMELFAPYIASFIEEYKPRLAQEEFSCQREFYENLFYNLFALCLDNNIQIKSSAQTIMQTAAYGWDINNQEQLEITDNIEQLILGLNEATDQRIEIAQAMKIISFLNYSANKTGADSAEIVQQQVKKLFAKKSQVREKFLETLWQSFRDIDFKTLKAAVDYPDKAHELDKARAFIVFFTSEIDDLKIKQRFVPNGKPEEMPRDGVFISQIMQLEKLRKNKGSENKKYSMIDMKYFLKNINNLPPEDESMEAEIRRYTTVQREARAHTGETAQNSRDATKGKKGKLVVDFYLQIGPDGKEEYVEQATDNGTGALKEVSLLIPDTTKTDGQQIDSTGFFGTGKYTIFEDVDRVEIITKNDKQSYMFTYQVTELGPKLVSIIEIDDERVQQGVTVRRIKAVENCMPELEQMLSIRAWKTFAGLSQNDNFKIYIVDSQGIERPLKVDAEILSETDFIAVKPGDKKATNFGKMRIWSAKDMPLQLIDSAGFRIKDMPLQLIDSEDFRINDIEKENYLQLVPHSLRKHVDELRMIIQIPLPLIDNRSGFENESRYLPIIRKYVAIEIYKAIAYKTLTSTVSGRQFTFENFPLNWERESNYWNAIDLSDEDIVHLAQQIDDAEYGLIANAQLRDLLPKKDLMDFDKKFVKLILLLEVITDWKNPEVRKSLFLRRKAVQELIDAKKAKASQALLESMGKRSSGGTLSAEDRLIFQDMIIAENQRKENDEMGLDIEQLIVSPEAYSSFEARFVLLANHIVNEWGLEGINIVQGGVNFDGKIRYSNDGVTLYLNRDIIGAEVLRGASSDYVINKAVDSLFHEGAHYLVDYLINFKGQVSLKKGFSAHKALLTHDSVGNFAEGMKYSAVIALANHKPFSELLTECPPNKPLRLDASISSLIAQAI